MSSGQLPTRIMFGNLEGVVRTGWDGKENEWAMACRATPGRLVDSKGLEKDGVGDRGTWCNFRNHLVRVDIHGHVEELGRRRG